MIRPITLEDAPAICGIYNHYIQNSTITFEGAIVSEAEMRERIKEVTKDLPWIVSCQNGKIVGYAYGSKWKGRCAYRYSAESTIYLDPSVHGKGMGKELYSELLSKLKNGGMHCVMGGIALPNEKSVGLHERLGFSKVAHFKEVGWKFEKWIDVGYWQLIFGNEK